MKSGAGDDPFAENAAGAVGGDAADDQEETENGADADDTETGGETPVVENGERAANGTAAPVEADSGSGAETDDGGSETTDGDETAGDAEPADGADEAAPEIPYKFRRSSVKEGRTQRPIFVRESVAEREPEFMRALEDEVGEEVYKTDALEAALIVAMDNPELVAEELRRWGYDWD